MWMARENLAGVGAGRANDGWLQLGPLTNYFKFHCCQPTSFQPSFWAATTL